MNTSKSNQASACGIREAVIGFSDDGRVPTGNEARKDMTKQNTQMFHKGWTRRLREAVLAGDDKVMEAALKQKADPSGKIAGGLASFVDHAAADSNVFGVSVLLEFGAVADAERIRHLAGTRGEMGYYPIHMAVFRGYTKALTRLLDARVDVDALCPLGTRLR